MKRKIFLQRFLRHHSRHLLYAWCHWGNVKKYSQHKGPHLCPYKCYTNPEKSSIIHALSIPRYASWWASCKRFL